MKATVLSDGGWGTAIAVHLCKLDHDVTLWGKFPDHIDELKRTRRNTRFLKGAQLPDKLGLTADMQTAVDGAELIVLATPTQYARETLTLLSEAGYTDSQILVNLSKGIEISSLKRLSQMCEEILGSVRYCVLSGPSHAEEVVHEAPTAVTAASEPLEIAEAVQAAFMSDYFRVYTSDDVTGVELGGSLKNVLAIAAGISDGMGLGDNAKAALLTRGIAEMARLGVKLGGKSETFSGLSGLGDIIVTCTSGHSRNRYVGENLGKGIKLEAVIESMGMSVAEGVSTTKSAYQLAHKVGVATPIIDEIYASLYEDKDPRQAVRDLMSRGARTEMD
jgi:glycerol-3-phosphate dehydrogenase (NAD(P)+)